MGIINEGLNWRKRPWEDVRKGGKQNYIIKNGVLGWGLSSAVLCSLALIFLSKELGMATYLGIALAIVVFLCLGYVWGMITWKIMEKGYQPENEEENEQENFANILKQEETLEQETMEPEIKEFSGTIVEVPFINKGGRRIEGASSLFLETAEGKYFIKHYEGDVSMIEVEKYIDKPIKVKAYKTFGLWDTDDPNVQSRVGDYVAIFEIL